MHPRGQELQCTLGQFADKILSSVFERVVEESVGGHFQQSHAEEQIAGEWSGAPVHPRGQELQCTLGQFADKILSSVERVGLGSRFRQGRRARNCRRT